MKFELPPHGITYKLIGANHYKHDIGLIVKEYGKPTKEYYLSKVGQFDKGLQDYILSIVDDIIEDKLRLIKYCGYMYIIINTRRILQYN